MSAPPPLTGGRLAIIAIALALGTFMMVLDSTIANVSLPTIAGNLGVANDTSTWVVTAFAVANGVFVPLTGWLMGRFGVVRTFCVAVALFTVASLLCGLAWDLPSLIGFRILQGAVAGPIMPGSQALLIAVFPPAKRATALGIWSMTTLVAPIMGPILGGYISDNYHWGWIFLINVPFGILVALVCWNGLKDRETPTRKLPIDTVGLALLVLWVGSLQVMLDLGKNADWFHDPLIVALGVLSAIAFVAWLIWELTDANPAVDLSLFKNRNFAIGSLAFCLGYAVFFANILLLPLWLQTQVGYTATWAGLIAAPSGVVAVLLTPFVARLSGKIDARILATVAFASFAASYWMRSGYTSTASAWDFTVPMLVQGIAMSTFFLSMLTISLDGGRAPADPVGDRADQLHPHRRRFLRRLDHHDDVGRPRGAPPEPPRRGGRHRRAVAVRAPVARGARADDDPDGGRGHAAAGPAGVPPRLDRPVPPFGLAVGGAGGDGLVHQTARVERRQPRGGGLKLPSLLLLPFLKGSGLLASPPLQRVGLVERLLPRFVALHPVLRIVLGRLGGVPSGLGGPGLLLDDLAVGLALRRVPLHRVAGLQALGHRGTPLDRVTRDIDRRRTHRV